MIGGPLSQRAFFLCINSMSHKSSVGRTRLLLIISGVLLLWAMVYFSPLLAANLGWVYLTRALVSESTHPSQFERARVWFALSDPSQHTSAYLGANIVAILQQHESPPSPVGGEGTIAGDRYIAVADHFVRQNQLDYAARLYRWDWVFTRARSQAEVALGHFCQMHRDAFAEGYPDTRRYCLEWLQGNQNNWLANPYFGGEEIPGWSLIPSNPTARAELRVDVAPPSEQAILTMSSNAALAESNALCQRVLLNPNEVAEFSVTLETKPQAQDSMQVRALYIAWRDSRQVSHGNHHSLLTEATSQAPYQRRFVLPDGASPGLLFCPAVLYGNGQVRISNVTLEISGIE